jgi:hypothetical protein
MRGVEWCLCGLSWFVFGVLRRLASCVFVVVGDWTLCGVRCYHARGWCELFHILLFEFIFGVVWIATICDDNDGNDGVYLGGIQCGSGM